LYKIEIDLLQYFRGSKHRPVASLEYYEVGSAPDAPAFGHLNTNGEWAGWKESKNFSEIGATDEMAAKSVLDGLKRRLFSHRRRKEMEAHKINVARRLRVVEVTPMRAAISMRGEQLLSGLVSWVADRQGDAHLDLLTSMPALCDDLAMMITEGYSEYALQLMNSIALVKSRTKTLVPGEVSFGSWLPWELSDITGQVERYELADNHIFAGSRFHQPTAFWFGHLGLDLDNKAVQRGMPVDSYTMPVYFGYGIVRLLRAAAVASC